MINPTHTTSLPIFRREIPHVCLSVRMEQLAHWTDFHEILYLRIFRKFVEKIQVSLKSDKLSGYLA